MSVSVCIWGGGREWQQLGKVGPGRVKWDD